MWQSETSRFRLRSVRWIPTRAAADQEAGEGGLHGANELDAVSAVVLADDFEVGKDGHSLGFPVSGLEAVGVGGAFVGAGDAEGGAVGFAQDAGCRPCACNGEGPVAIDRGLQGAGDAVGAEWQDDIARAFVDGVLEGLGIVDLAVRRLRQSL